MKRVHFHRWRIINERVTHSLGNGPFCLEDF
jgi:hypothetical protein